MIDYTSSLFSFFSQFVSLSDIERLTKRPKETKADKMAGAKVAREDRGDFGRPKPKLNPHASTTNKQKSRKKNFMMIRQKVRGKQKRSFRDKQVRYGFWRLSLCRKINVLYFLLCRFHFGTRSSNN